MNKKILITVLILTALVLTGCTKKSNLEKSVEEIGKAKTEGELMEKVEKANKQLEKKAPDNLSQCTEEILKDRGNCSTLPQNKVCGYDHTTYEGGKVADHGLTYNNACSYCQFFGKEGQMELGTTIVKALGYPEGECQ